MNPEQKQNQPEKAETKSSESGIWTSAFENKSGSSMPPPPKNGVTAGPVVQKQGAPKPVSPTQVAQDADKIHEVCAGYFTDGADAVAVLRGKSIAHLKAMRIYYQAKYSIALEQHLKNELNATNYRAAMIFLLPALTLMQRLALQKGWDDNEEAMIALIKASVPAERAQAREEGKIEAFILGELDWPEAYEMHKLIYPPASFPGQHFKVAKMMMAAGKGWFWDDDDYVYMVILDLNPAQRKLIWDQMLSKIDYVSASRAQLKKLCLGTDAEVIKTTMDLATDGIGTYDNLAEKTVNAAAEKLKREQELKTKAAQGDKAAQKELGQIGDIQGLVKPKFENGELSTNSFLGDIEGDMSEEEFKKFAAQVGKGQYDEAKRLILNAVGFFNDDEKAMKNAFESIKDEALRRKLWADADVQAAFKAALLDTEKLNLAAYREGDSYKIAEDKFLEITERWVFGDPSYVELIQLFTTISAADRIKLVTLFPRNLRKFTGSGEGYNALSKALYEAAHTGKVNLEHAMTAAGDGLGTSDELITSTLDSLSDLEYFQLRLGYALSSGFQVDEKIIPGHLQQAARDRYAWLIEKLDEEMGFDQKQTTLDIFLKAPSLIEMQNAGGSEMSMFVLQQRIHDKIGTRNGSMADGFIDLFSNTGGVADIAAMQSLGVYYQALQDGNASSLDLAAMAGSYDQFTEAYDAHVAACDSVADLAATVAAIAVAVAITVASAGTAGGAAAAGLAAYLGGASASTVVGAAVAAGATRVAVNAAIGGEHYSVADEGAKSMVLGGVDGALTAVTAGIAKSLQMAFFKAIGVKGTLVSEMLVGEVMNATENSLKLMGQQAAVGGTRGAIDGAISGAIGNVVLTAADESTWRKGIWDTLSTFGMSLIQGAGMGLVAGGVMGGGVAAGGGLLAKGQVGKLEDFATKAGIDMGDLKNLSFDRRRMVGTLSDHIKAGEADKAEKVLLEMQAEIGQDPATRIRKQLYVANNQPLAKPHIDAYMEQLIRRQGRAFDIEQQQWVELEGFFHGDPACLQTFIRRTDEDMMYALRMAKEEADEVSITTHKKAHSLSRHGADVTDAKLDRRVKTGFAPDGAMSKTRNSSRFKNYKDQFEMKQNARQLIEAGRGDPGATVDLRFAPGVNGNQLHDSYVIVVEYSSRTDLTDGFRGTGPSVHGTYATTVPMGPGINRVRTLFKWFPDAGKWITIQHFPDATDFDFATNSYLPTARLNVTI